jgi:hypothetical protein
MTKDSIIGIPTESSFSAILIVILGDSVMA